MFVSNAFKLVGYNILNLACTFQFCAEIKLLPKASDGGEVGEEKNKILIFDQLLIPSPYYSAQSISPPCLTPSIPNQIQRKCPRTTHATNRNLPLVATSSRQAFGLNLEQLFSDHIAGLQERKKGHLSSPGALSCISPSMGSAEWLV